MNTTEILKNIAQRCGGDIYLGIVGPVRVGKSTFIKEFMEKAVIPYVNDEYEKARMIDELPQAGVGKTIMTTEPKFVPNNAATIEFEDGFTVNVRLVDCVGYVIPEAKGYKDEDGIRMVRTPWSDEAMPFNEAAKIGTQKVIQDHSTIGIVVTTDGSISDLSREAYIEAEAEVIDELKSIGKPFIVVVNSSDVNSLACKAVVDKLKEKYEVPVLAIAVNNMSENDVHDILREALYEFPVSEININMPQWIAVLDDEHWLKKSFNQTIQDSMSSVEKLKEVENIKDVLNENEYIDSSNIATIDTGAGVVNVDITIKNGLYNEILKEIIGVEIKDKSELIALMQEYSKAKREYDTISSALKMVKQTGYGFASASLQDIELSKPEIIKQGSRYGVKLKAIAPSIHMIKVDVESSFEPIIGSKEQSEELIRYLLRDEGNDDGSIWDSDIFGRKLSDLIRDGLNAKLSMIPEAARIRLQDILTKLVNKGKGNVIAIVL
ncbi:MULTISPECIES: stage IV sporulation protein A [Bacillota]|jgi:stage IV sporulation protein A|uniref:Stage IV sporulation protein A n=2 Tax=Amedibacillus TaxID=2749846 RepID=A0A7G9GMG2_9FIRM|nr:MULTISPECIES: stage IV sporulation protein A [Bacillota]QNM11994.1 stage IV sporulation protein A [[Eubacterium] hominis]MCH4286656.1 stage IV sporulation protein A [Amedibacillus hominis]RGB53061.1 stage IV sporulation protein A [Absiella sp. AM22-9]RGB59352.1 stage IV sporulation protein A [Absiella sp. AM10-20]RGB66677.1 stage IV sporulation protein A [Absiella sp. AM09-45]